MRRYKRKTWKDPLVEAANGQKNWPERELRRILQIIARTKHTDVPGQILEELRKSHSQVRFSWLSTPRGGMSAPRLTSAIAPHVLSEKGLQGRIPLGSGSGYYPEQDTYNRYVFGLISNLMDDNWVRALRECEGCGNLLLSLGERPKYCSSRCRRKTNAKESRKRKKGEEEVQELIECPWIGERITRAECNDKSRRNLYNECETCSERR